MAKKPKKSVEIVQHKATGLERELVLEDEQLVLPKKSLTLATWASKYMESEVIGVKSRNTVQAKKRDLSAFLKFFYEQNGHLDITDWLPRDTQGFIEHLEQLGRVPTTINRMFATVRTFAIWVHAQPNTPFIGGLPTRGIRELITDEPKAKKLSTREVNRLFKAADKRIVTDTRKNARPKRDAAILALLYHTGLRVSELCNLRLKQHTGTHLVNVRRKGKKRTKGVYLSTKCRAYLDDYLQTERQLDDPDNALDWLILAPGSAAGISRSTAWRAVMKLAHEASKHNQKDIHLYPHRLRHTFGYEVRKRTGSDNETAVLLGHSGLKYVGRYARNTDEERAAILEDL